MSSQDPARVAVRLDRGTILIGSALLILSVAAWISTWRAAGAMSMGASDASLASQAAGYTLRWGVMMTAMMLPSAAPMILLYRTVATGLSGSDERAIPSPLFAAVYLGVWTIIGLVVFAASIAIERVAAGSAAAQRAFPYAVAGVIAMAALYQLSALKIACLKQCESPLTFLMARWRSSYRATLGLAVRHALYCLGCCWGLMLILVAAGAMSLPWVLLISLLVFAEKALPGGQRTAAVIGALLALLAAAVVVRPELATTMRFEGASEAPAMEELPGMEGMPGM